MIAWLLKKTAPANQSSHAQNEPMRSAPAGNCALWHDVARALDAKPKGQSK